MSLVLGCLGLVAAFSAGLGGRLVVVRRELAAAEGRLQRLARIDSLTGLLNRRYLTEQLRLACAASRRHGFPVAVLMVDIDHLKQLNVLFGESAGDDAIRYVADRLASSLRTEDLAARWDGEEFVLVLPHTSLDEAHLVAERLRSDIAARPATLGPDGDIVQVLVSVGIAEQPGAVAEALVHRAQVALGAAKRSGGNTVCSSETALAGS
jgi:two-component system cell cycle response regulator